MVWGEKYLVRGFTRSPESDLAFAIGTPHLRRLIENHSDDALDGDALKAKLLHDYGTDIPAAHAARRVRTMAAFMCGPDGSWREQVYPAFEDNSPFTAKTAAAFIADHLAKREQGMGRQRDIAFTLEALVGADVVLEAITVSFEAKSDAELGKWNNSIADWGAIAGILLLRTSKDVGDGLLPRLESVIERAKGAERASIAARLAATIHGHRSTDKPSFDDLQWWSDAPKDVLHAALDKVEINKWCFSVSPRLAMLGGEKVIDLYRERWNLLKDADDQKQLVELFGEIDHPKIAVLMEDMANRSKAKKATKAWLDAKGGSGKAPTKSVVKAAEPAKTVKLEVPPLDPARILERLDVGVRGNDWPDFFELNPEDVLHGMRLVGARAGEDWGLAIERLQGDDPETLMCRTWIYGSNVKENIEEETISFAIEDGEAIGPRGPFDLKKVKGKNPKFEAIARAYHAHFGGGLWPNAETTTKLLGLGSDATIVVCCDAFTHVALASGKKKQALPSASKTYISLAEAIATGDGSKFTPGKSNV